MKLGMILRTGWRAEHGVMADPAAAFANLMEEAAGATSSGVGALFAYDHLEGLPSDREASFFDAWTSLSAVAGSVPRGTELGTLVSGVSLRNIGLLAKQAVTLDAICSGHAILGLGAGWYRDELRRFGIPVLPFAKRAAAVAHSIHAVRALWSGQPVSMAAGLIHLDEALGSPAPVGGIMPIWVGGSGEAMREIATSHANGINIGGTLDEVAAAVDDIERRLASKGRSREDFTISIEAQVLHDPTNGELDRVAHRSGSTAEDFVTWNLVGDASSLQRRAHEYRSRGVDRLIMFAPLASGRNAIHKLVATVERGS